MFNVRCLMFAFAAIVIATGFLNGCDKPPAAVVQKPTVPAGAGIVRGVVSLLGTPPTMQTLGGDCCPGAAPIVDESISVRTGGSLRNVVVFIQNGPNVDVGPMPERVLAQKDCRYVPHVLAVRSGQTVVVTSHDPTPHNVHIEAEANPSQNFSELMGASHAVNFAQPELVKFKCDVHPWMTAYVYVFDHPCFAVTADDGRFEIGHLPPGNYTLVAWQEKLGEQKLRISVAADKPTEVKFEYRGE